MKMINEVSSIVGVTKRTLQYYDDEDVLRAKRSKENYRLYGKQEFQKAWDIVFLQTIDFKLNELKAVKFESEDWNIAVLDEKIAEINTLARELERKIRVLYFIREYGIPPICLREDYVGKANYVGCVEAITEVIGMSVIELEKFNISPLKEEIIPTYFNKNFFKWMNDIQDSKVISALKSKLFQYCEERR